MGHAEKTEPLGTVKVSGPSYPADHESTTVHQHAPSLARYYSKVLQPQLKVWVASEEGLT